MAAGTYTVRPCIHVHVHLSVCLLSGAYLLFPWPNLAYTSPIKSLWVMTKDVQ